MSTPSNKPVNWFLEAYTKKYCDFSGRARRSEYWFFTLFFSIAYMAFCFVAGALSAITHSAAAGLLPSLFALASLLPSLGVAVRRLHDTGRSGWWMLLSFLPLIGGIVLLVFMVTEGEAGNNQYGANPKA